MLFTVDIGTSSLKTALWDYDGNRHFFASAPLPMNIIENFKYETECAKWLRAFEDCCAEISKKNPKNISNVEAIVISGNGPSLVPVLEEPEIKNGKLSLEAANALLWLDRRAVKYQAEVSEVMGGFVDAGFFLPKIQYLKNEEKGLYKKVKYFLGCPEYLSYALTGEAKTVFPCEGFDRWFWNDSVLEKLKLDKKKFPGFIRPGDPFGMLIPSAADNFGFKKNIPVISGGPDFFASILGAGVTEPAQACDRTGSSEGINLCTRMQVSDKRLMSYGHPVKPYWNLSGIINTTGKAVEWCRNLLGISSFEDFFALAKMSKPGSSGLIFNPYLAGERAPFWDPSIRAHWRGISLSSGRSEFANSVLEGIGFAVKDVITAMEETGEKTAQLRVTGSMAGNACLNQIKADITGLEILEGKYREGELLGLAVIGSCFLGRYSSFAQACSAMVHVENKYEPDLKNAELYKELFFEYRKNC